MLEGAVAEQGLVIMGCNMQAHIYQQKRERGLYIMRVEKQGMVLYALKWRFQTLRN